MKEDIDIKGNWHKTTNISEGLILIPFGNTFLALSQEEFKKAFVLGQEIVGITQTLPQMSTEDNRLLDAEEASKITGVPASWFEEKARQGKIPHIRFGKYPRFRMKDLIEAFEIRPRQEAKVTSARIKAI